jgi:hypothetical protein
LFPFSLKCIAELCVEFFASQRNSQNRQETISDSTICYQCTTAPKPIQGKNTGIGPQPVMSPPVAKGVSNWQTIRQTIRGNIQSTVQQAFRHPLEVVPHDRQSHGRAERSAMARSRRRDKSPVTGARFSKYPLTHHR